MDFETKSKNSEFWFIQANQMLAASEALYSSLNDPNSLQEAMVGYHKGSMFLLGISIENALKGVLASRGKLKVEHDRISLPKCKNHDLNDIAKLINIEMTNYEFELLERLSIYTIWAGKYGTPLRKSEYTNAQGKQYQSDVDFDLAKNLIIKLKNTVDVHNNSGY